MVRTAANAAPPDMDTSDVHHPAQKGSGELFRLSGYELVKTFAGVLGFRNKAIIFSNHAVFRGQGNFRARLTHLLRWSQAGRRAVRTRYEIFSRLPVDRLLACVKLEIKRKNKFFDNFWDARHLVWSVDQHRKNHGPWSKPR